MLKKAAASIAVLSLLLAASQLALAQQNTDQTQGVEATFQATGGTQTTGADQGTAADPAQQDPSQDQQATGGSQPAQPDRGGLMHLNANNNLVIDCPAVSARIAQLTQLEQTQASDPQLQSELTQANELAQVCAEGGFTPTGSAGSDGSSSDGTTPTQPQ